ncbi:uncharacterized protein LOC132281338 [Cornus florida]|uniref:uncharacterized protein LOC132281338 n=1 Tax=Cornus florida TaxID=4283 RepID=UPI00289B3E15|nr:uncharacterized protein LOC132281338 [Cornus florida]
MADDPPAAEAIRCLKDHYEPGAYNTSSVVQYPQAGKQASKLQDIMEIFKQVKINLPLLDAIQQIPAYAKFWKDMCTQKRRSNSHVPKKVLLTEQIGKTKQPRGVIDDVIIKVDKFYFPVDFIVLDTEPVPESRRRIPVILGRPFLATANVSINYRNDVMDLSFGNMNVRLNIFNSNQCPSDDKDYFFVDTIDECVEEMVPFALTKDPLEAYLSYFDTESFDVDKSIEEVNVTLDGANMHNIPPWKIPIEPLLPLLSEPPTPSLKSPPEIELKSYPFI